MQDKNLSIIHFIVVFSVNPTQIHLIYPQLLPILQDERTSVLRVALATHTKLLPRVMRELGVGSASRSTELWAVVREINAQCANKLMSSNDGVKAAAIK